jgi:hypothetical protein
LADNGLRAWLSTDIAKTVVRPKSTRSYLAVPGGGTLLQQNYWRMCIPDSRVLGFLHFHTIHSY